MKLPTLKPTLPMLKAQHKTLDIGAGATPRQAGSGWMKTRERIQVAQQSMCADCGLLWQAHIDHVDHDVPLERGGSNDDSNLRLRCQGCHAEKTRREARERSGGR